MEWSFILIYSETNAEDKDGEESDSTKVVYIVLAVLGVLLFLLGALVGIYFWIDRKKTKELTKDRVSVNYKYDPMKRVDTTSVITDPRVTNDLKWLSAHVPDPRMAKILRNVDWNITWTYCIYIVLLNYL